MYLEWVLATKSSTKINPSTPCLRQLVMSFILSPKRVTDSTLPCRSPVSKVEMSDSTDMYRTQKLLCCRNLVIKFGREPLNPTLNRSLKHPCLQVVSYAFSKSKKIATTCSLFKNPFADNALEPY